MTEKELMNLEKRLKQEIEAKAEAIDLFEKCIYAVVPAAAANPDFHIKAELAIEAITKASSAQVMTRLTEAFSKKK